MADKTIKVRTKAKIDTEENWDKSTLIIKKGEFAINSTTHEVRYGDGTHTYKNSPPAKIAAQNVTTDSTHRFVSDTEKSSWNDKAPKSHASINETYGIGNGMYYGHVSLSDEVNSTVDSDSGIAATPKAVKQVYDAVNQVYDLANSKANSSHTHTADDLSGVVKQDASGNVNITGNLRLKGSGNYGNKINFGDNEYVYMHEGADDKLKIFAEKGITFETDSEDEEILFQTSTSGKVKFDCYSFDVNGKELRYLTRTADVVIAASNTPANCKNSADYVCDGTDDQAEINTAIQTLTNGGKIVLLGGTYNISSAILLNKSNVTLDGMGIGATTLKATSTSISPICSVTGGYCTLREFSITGAAKTAGRGVYIAGDSVKVETIKITNINEGIVLDEDWSDNIITKIKTYNCNYPIYLSDSDNSTISNCYLLNGICGIKTDLESHRITILGCMIEQMSGNGIEIDGTDYRVTNNYFSNCTSCGIYVYNTHRSIISNNEIEGGNAGIALYYGHNALVNSNVCYNTGKGFSISQSDHVNVCHNIFMRGTGQASNYSSAQHTMEIGTNTTNCIFADNHIPGKNYTDSSSSTTNKFSNNITA